MAVFDLYNKISLLLPNIAHPIRVSERRKGYSGHTLEITLSGLSVRLEEDKGGTAIKKIYYPETWRFSHDLDFTWIDQSVRKGLGKRD